MAKKIFELTQLLLLAAAVYFCTVIFYDFVEIKLDYSDRITSAGGVGKAAAAFKRRLPQSDYHAIVDRNLFQTGINKKSRNKIPAVDLGVIKQTDLNLNLLGTVTTGDKRSDIARAVIENSGLKKQGLYKVGDSIENGEITEIHRNSVVLIVQGRTEKLTLKEKSAGSGTAVNIPEKIQQQISEKTVAGTGRGISLKPAVFERSQVENALEDIGRLMEEVDVRPFYRDGTAAGIVVANIAPESVIRDTGIKDGDIIESVNGQQIRTAEDAMELYDKLKAGEKLTVSLIRRGRPHTIEYAIGDDL